MIGKEILTYIDASEVVSFDIFDTLIVRNVCKPSDIFILLEKQLKKRNLINQEIDFVELRMSSQRKAYAKKSEVTLREIYAEMDAYSQDEQKQFMEIEVEIEKKICVPNFEMVEVYDYCLKNHKRIIITSDMYLSKNDLVNILENCGYRNFHSIYVSSEYGKRKSNGTLFALILKTENIRANSIFHIGDNYKSDYIVPKLYRIRSYHYVTKEMKEVESDSCQLDKICINYYDEEWSEYFKFGFVFLGALMYQFSMWLNEQCKNRGIRKIYFLSREGYFLNECYKCCFKEQKTEYIYLSRKTVRALELINCDSAQKVIEILELRVNATIKVFFEKCGLDYENYKNISEQYGYSADSVIVLDKSFYSFVDYLMEDILIKAKEQYEVLYLYLKQKEFFDEGMALVDIGWKGTMQNSLSKFLKSEPLNINGFYFGIINMNRKNVYGFLDDCDQEIEAGMTLFETLFMAEHGTTIGYLKNREGLVQPILAESEFSNFDKESIREIQKGALHYLKLINNIDEEYLLDFTSETPKKRLLNLAINPEHRYIDLLQNLSFFDSFKSQLVCPIEKLTQAKKSLIYSGWKIAFLKKILRLKIIPYLKLYFFLKKKGRK